MSLTMKLRIYATCTLLLAALTVLPADCADTPGVSVLVPPARALSARPEAGDYAGLCESPLSNIWVMPGSHIHFLSPGYPEKNFTYDYFCGWTFVALNGLPLDMTCTVTLGTEDYLRLHDNVSNETESIDNVHEANVTRTFKGSSVSVWLETLYHGQERTVNCFIWSYNPVPFPPEALLMLPPLRSSIAPSFMCRCGVPLERRIIGGRPARADRHRWMVTLGLGLRTQFCGGTLISNSWIVTAAHCLEKTRFYQPGTRLSVGLGFYRLRAPLPTSISRTVREAVFHPHYNSTTHENDIALLRIDPLDWEDHPTVRPACLPNEPEALYEGNTGIVIGWGVLSDDSTNPFTLMEVPLPIISNSVCQTYNRNRTLHNMICAGAPGGHASCRGDSGGPLVVMEGDNAVLVGVVSWGNSCGRIRPTVFTRVTKFLSWIEHTTLGTEFCPRI